MIIGPKKLLKLVKEIQLVEDLAERELTNPEGAGFDLRLGEVHEIFGDAFLGVEERQTPKIRSVAKYSAFAKATADKQKSKRNKIIIKPNEFYLISTIEKVNLPQNI